MEDMLDAEDLTNLREIGCEEGNEGTDTAVDATETMRVETLTDEALVAPKGKGRRSKFQGILAARDFRFLIWYIVTKRCRRIPWDLFFENAKKGLISLISFAA